MQRLLRPRARKQPCSALTKHASASGRECRPKNCVVKLTSPSLSRSQRSQLVDGSSVLNDLRGWLHPQVQTLSVSSDGGVGSPCTARLTLTATIISTHTTHWVASPI